MDEFKNLHWRIKKLLSDFGFRKPTPPQEKAIPIILDGKNSLLIAPTGTGKTEAAILPIFTKFLKKRDRVGTKILYIAPLRALNRDMRTRLKKWGEHLEIDIQVRHGDTSRTQRRRQSLNPPDMLITTPETLQAIITGKRLKEHLSSIDWVIVDEIHELAESKRGTQLTIGLERLSRIAGEFQRIGLSATIGEPLEISKFLAGSNRDVSIIDSTALKEMSIKIEGPMPIESDMGLEEKLNAQPTMIARLRRIKELMKEHDSILIFTNTREAAESLGSRLKFWNPEMPIKVHHGSLSRETRINAEEKFRNGELKGLICTSSMELGIDIGEIDHIIQYMSPRQVARLIQRVGRSGHFIDAASHGVIITTNPDDALEAGVIGRKFMKNDLESVGIHRKALDVLSHQLVGLAIDGVRDIGEAYGLVTKAYPYQDLSEDELVDTLQQLKNQGIIWFEGRRFNPRRPAWPYYYSNLSMIPDTKRYLIRDLPSGKPIGRLDEEFVIARAKPGVTFICRGEVWKVVEIEDDQVIVETVKDPYGAIPSWEGELIPVPFEIAQKVGKIRGEISDDLKSGIRNTEIVDKIRDSYFLDKNSADWIIKYIKDQGIKKTPNDLKFLIETYDRFAVIHTCLGTTVNETLAQILASLLSARIGSSVGVRSDPYRIAFRFPEEAEIDFLDQTLKELKPEHLEPLVNKILKNSSVFQWKLLHVAKRFGSIKKDADFSHVKGNRLLMAFEGTPIWMEAEREVRLEKLDVDKLKEVITDFQRNVIKSFKIRRSNEEGPTPMSWPIVNELASYGELVVPDRAERYILKTLKNRLLNRMIRLFCINCRDWSTLTRVKRLSKYPKCKNCGARFLTIVSWRGRKVENIFKRALKGEELREEEIRILNRKRKAGNLILTYGKKAIIAMAARGVGPTTVTRILTHPQESELDFYRAILKQERLYARTHEFWD